MKDPACKFVRSLGLRGWVHDNECLRKGNVFIKTTDIRASGGSGVNYVILINGKAIHVSRCKDRYYRLDPAPMHDIYFKILTNTNKTNRFSLPSLMASGKNLIRKVF